MIETKLIKKELYHQGHEVPQRKRKWFSFVGLSIPYIAERLCDDEECKAS
jgi:hypothetical protein